MVCDGIKWSVSLSVHLRSRCDFAEGLYGLQGRDRRAAIDWMRWVELKDLHGKCLSSWYCINHTSCNGLPAASKHDTVGVDSFAFIELDGVARG